MAEPLLRRTFSRLRGKDRSRRKTQPKSSDVSGKSDSISQSSTGSSLLASAEPEASPPSGRAPSQPSPPRTHITVAKKQQWAKQAASTRDSPAYGLSERDHAAPPGWSQRLIGDQMECPVSSLLPSSTPQDVPHSSGLPSDPPAPPTSSKLSGQGAYLQSLERSSRAWVLSSGKAQAPDEASMQSAESCRLQEEPNIWYNPIPEEEDGGRWRSRGEGEGEAIDTQTRTSRRLGSIGAGGGGMGGHQSSDYPTSSHHFDDITAENLDVLHHECPASDSSPSSQKKGGVSGSMMDRIKSPGTVRKLSMKMKKLPELRRKLSLRSSRSNRHGNDSKGGGGTEEGASTCKDGTSLTSQNVLSRYHLDSSAPPARAIRRSSRGRSSSKGGYLSDGDSPELLPRQQAPPPAAPHDRGCDVSSFRLYVGSEQPRCAQRVTGLLTVHLLGLEEMMKASSRDDCSKEVFLAIQVDGLTRARTSGLTLKGSSLPLNHTFHLELERARLLRLVVLSPGGGASPGPGQSQVPAGPAPSASGPTRNRVCCLGGVSIPPLFKACRSQQLCVKLEPRGLLYVKLSLQEPFSLPQLSGDVLAPSSVFGVELQQLVGREASDRPIPLLIQKTVTEIESRGLKVVGLYRLCGSAAVKKELRDSFERNSSAVCLNQELYPDINVITGILKDYLRELPSPLITRTLYEVVLEAMAVRPAPPPPATPDPLLAQRTVALLDCLPPPEMATLSLLLDHLSLVASYSAANRMTHQNLAVCFGPVLLTPSPEAWRAGGGSAGGRRDGAKAFSAMDFKRHIEALHYLLQLWPVPATRAPADEETDITSSLTDHLAAHNPLCSQQCRPVLRLDLPHHQEEEVVVSRRGRGLTRLESPPPINRYAGDWSVCGRDFLSEQEADYDEVAGSESEHGSEEEEEEEKKEETWSSAGLYVDDLGLDFDAPFSCRLSLKDFDTLIHDLERELAKQINICL